MRSVLLRGPMSTRTASVLLFSSLGLLLFACGSDAVTDPPAGSTSSTSSSSGGTSDASPSDASGDAAGDDDCTSSGYECHSTPTCKPEFMPLQNISCGAQGGYCCVKGALPPSDASTDG